jgi:hypothetical protein
MLALASFAYLVRTSRSEAHVPGVVLSAYGTAAIDGALDLENEWGSAAFMV